MTTPNQDPIEELLKAVDALPPKNVTYYAYDAAPAIRALQQKNDYMVSEISRLEAMEQVTLDHNRKWKARVIELEAKLARVIEAGNAAISAMGNYSYTKNLKEEWRKAIAE